MPKIKSISPSMSQKVVTTKYLAKFQSPRVTTRPKNHWTETKRKLDLQLIIIHPHTKYQVNNISKHSEKNVVTTEIFRNNGHG